MNLFIQDRLKGKNYIVGIERVAVRELYSLPKFEFPVQPVMGPLPGFGEGGFGSQRLPVDVDQVRHQPLQHLARARVRRNTQFRVFGSVRCAETRRPPGVPGGPETSRRSSAAACRIHTTASVPRACRRAFTKVPSDRFKVV